MSHILSGRNKPSLDFVMKVINRFPEIDINWLLNGTGEMYVLSSRTHNPSTPSAQPSQFVSQPTKPEPVMYTAEPAKPLQSGSKNASAEGFNEERCEAATASRSAWNAPTLFDTFEDEPITEVAPPAPQQEPQRVAPQPGTPVYGADSAIPPQPSAHGGSGFSRNQTYHSATVPQPLAQNRHPAEAVFHQPSHTVADIQSDMTAGMTSAQEMQPVSAAEPRAEYLARASATANSTSVSAAEQSFAESTKSATKGLSEVKNRTQNVKKIVKIIMIYEDHTFSEFTPEP